MIAKRLHRFGKIGPSCFGALVRDIRALGAPVAPTRRVSWRWPGSWMLRSVPASSYNAALSISGARRCLSDSILHPYPASKRIDNRTRPAFPASSILLLHLHVEGRLRLAERRGFAMPSSADLQKRFSRIYDHLYASGKFKTPSGICGEVGKILA